MRERRRRKRERRRDDGGNGGGATPHDTFNVNGAVTTRPSTRVWRNSRHVPGTGKSTPTFSLPGVVDVPVTFDAPKMLVHPETPGAQTCVWK